MTTNQLFHMAVVLSLAAPSFATEVNDVLVINRRYSSSYFDYLQTKKTSQIELAQISANQAELQPHLNKASAEYNRQYSVLAPLQQKIAGIPVTITALETRKAGAQSQQDFAKTQAVEKTYFLVDEIIDEQSLAVKISERTSLIQMVQTEVDALTESIHQITQSESYNALQLQFTNRRDHVARLQQRLAHLLSKRDNLEISIQGELRQIDTLSRQIRQMQERQSQIEARDLPQALQTTNRVRSDLQSLDVRVNESQTAINELRATVSDLYNRSTALNSKKQQLQNRLETYSAEHADIYRKLEQINVASQQLKDIAKTQIPAAQTDVTTKSREVAEFNRAVQDTQKQVNETVAALSTAQGEAQAAKDRQNNASNDLSALTAELTQVNQAVTGIPALQNRRDHLISTAIPQVGTQLQTAQQNLQNAQTNEEQMVQASNQAQAKRDIVQMQVAKVSSDLDGANKKIATVTQKAEQLRQQIAAFGDLENLLNTAQAQKAEAEKALATSQTERDASATHTEALRVKLEKLIQQQPAGAPDTPEITTTRQRLESSQKRLSNLEKQIAQNKNTIAQSEMAINDLNAKKKNKDQLVVNLEKIEKNQLPRVLMEKQVIEAALADANTQLAQAQKELNQAQAQIATAAAQTQKVQARISKLQTQLADLNNEKVQIEATLNHLQSTVERKKQLESQLIPAAQNRMQAADQDLAQKNQNVTSMKKVVADMRARLAVVQAKKQQSEETLQQTRSHLADLQRQRSELERIMAEAPLLQQRKGELENNLIPQTGNELTQVTQQSDAVNTQYKRETNRLEILQSRQNELLARRQDLAEQVNAADVTLRKLQNESSQLINSINQSQKTITSSQVRLSELQTQLTETLTGIPQTEAQIPLAQKSADKALEKFNNYISMHIEPLEIQISEKLKVQDKVQVEKNDLLDLKQTLQKTALTINEANQKISELQIQLPQLQAQEVQLASVVLSLKQNLEALSAQQQSLIDKANISAATVKEKKLTLKNLESEQDEIIRQLTK